MELALGLYLTFGTLGLSDGPDPTDYFFCVNSYYTDTQEVIQEEDDKMVCQDG